MFDIDRLIVSFDRALRTVVGPAATARPMPGQKVGDGDLDASQRSHAAALMRVNHTGEVCAQALYQGQALTARSASARQSLDHAAQEETDHLAWTERRIQELGGRRSVLNPLFYSASFALGAAAGLLGDRWNLGFLAETERQVVAHLDEHLDKLPAADAKSRAIVEEMRVDELQHATTAFEHGGVELPLPARALMRIASAVMTSTTYWI
jgi:ubiquinone biosynthesis monooxygenase Coq7